MSMPSWTESYNCHKLNIGGHALKIEVSWHRDGYEVSCNGRQVKGTIRDLSDAKAAGIRLARKIVSEASADLDAVS
jgi:hypothetical protein